MASIVKRKSRMKFCLFRNCNTKSKDNADIAFFSFPRPCMKVRRKQVVAGSDHVKNCSACEKCTKWISMCRIDSLYYSDELVPLKKAKDLDICSLHFVNGHPYSTKFPDPLPAKTVLDIKVVQDILLARQSSNQKTKTRRQYHLLRTYDITSLGDREVVIKKKLTEKDDVIVYVTPYEDFFDILHVAHLDVGHGCRDKMRTWLRNKYQIPRPAIEKFLDTCEICKVKKNRIKQHHQQHSNHDISWNPTDLSDYHLWQEQRRSLEKNKEPTTLFLPQSTIHKRKAPPEAAECSSSQPDAKKINSELIEHIEVDDLSLKVEDDSHNEIINDRLMNSIGMPEDIPVTVKEEGTEDPLEIYQPELSPLEFDVEEGNPFTDDKCGGLINELEVDYSLKFGIKEENNLPSLPSLNNSDITTLTPDKFECNQLHKETQTIPIRSRLQELERENEFLKLEVARLRRVLKARSKQCSVCESMLC